MRSPYLTTNYFVYLFQNGHGRRTFSPEDSATLLRICKPLLSRSTLSGMDVQKLLMLSKEGMTFLLRMQFILGSDYRKKLADRVRAEMRKLKKSR